MVSLFLKRDAENQRATDQGVAGGARANHGGPDEGDAHQEQARQDRVEEEERAGEFSEQPGQLVAQEGCKKALTSDANFLAGLNICQGNVTYKAVADDLNYEYVTASSAIN